MSDRSEGGITNTKEAKNIAKFLQFELDFNTRALLPAETVTEIITISAREILPVPQMGDCVMGIYSWRSEMLWIIDLKNFLGSITKDSPTSKQLSELESAEESGSLMAIALEFEGNFLGFYVRKINDILELDSREINRECQEIFAAEILPFLQGYFIDTEGQILMVLKPESLFKLAAIEE